jgi:hypothetical protein
MPTKTITVCANCEKVSCDGSIWRKIKITNIKDNTEQDMSKIPEENLENCSLGHGISRLKYLKNKKVGDEVELTFNNWVDKAKVIVKKIID